MCDKNVGCKAHFLGYLSLLKYGTKNQLFNASEIKFFVICIEIVLGMKVHFFCAIFHDNLGSKFTLYPVHEPFSSKSRKHKNISHNTTKLGFKKQN